MTAGGVNLKKTKKKAVTGSIDAAVHPDNDYLETMKQRMKGLPGHQQENGLKK